MSQLEPSTPQPSLPSLPGGEASASVPLYQIYLVYVLILTKQAEALIFALFLTEREAPHNRMLPQRCWGLCQAQGLSMDPSAIRGDTTGRATGTDFWLEDSAHAASGEQGGATGELAFMMSSVELISEAYGTPSVRSKQTSAFFPHPQGFDSSDLTFPRIQWGAFFFFFLMQVISAL